MSDETPRIEFLRRLAAAAPDILQPPPPAFRAALAAARECPDVRVRAWATAIQEAADRTRPPTSVGETKSVQRRLTGWRNGPWLNLDLIVPGRLVRARGLGTLFLVTVCEFDGRALARSHLRVEKVDDLESVEPAFRKLYGRWAADGFEHPRLSTADYELFGYESRPGFFGWLQDLLDVEGAGDALSVRDDIQDEPGSYGLPPDRDWALLRYLEYLDWTSHLQAVHETKEKAKRQARAKAFEQAALLARAHPASITGQARSLLRRVQGAYDALETLRLEGVIVQERPMDRFPDAKTTTAFAAAFAAPNRFRLHVGPDRWEGLAGSVARGRPGSEQVCDGSAVRVYDPSQNAFSTVKVPPGKWPLLDGNGFVSRKLNVGDPSLRITVHERGVDSLTLGDARVEQSPDVMVDGRVHPALLVTRPGDYRETFLFDPDSLMLRRVTRQPSPAKKFPHVTTIDYHTVAPNVPVSDEVFHWMPPPGATPAPDVE